jgi:hypothetical protein
VAGGYGIVLFDRDRNLQRFVGEGSFRYRLPNGWTWWISSANRFVAEITGNQFVETTGRMGVQKYFGESLALSAALFLSRFENDAWDLPENLFGGAELRAEYGIARRTRVALTYRYWENEGDLSFDDFHQNRVALELSYRR